MNINYDFSANKQLSDYGLQASSEFPFQSVQFDGGVLKLITLAASNGELLIKTDARNIDVSFNLKVKNMKGNATSNSNALRNDEYVKTATMGLGSVIVSVNRGETFEFTGYSLAAD